MTLLLVFTVLDLDERSGFSLDQNTLPLLPNVALGHTEHFMLKRFLGATVEEWLSMKGTITPFSAWRGALYTGRSSFVADGEGTQNRIQATPPPLVYHT